MAWRGCWKNRAKRRGSSSVASPSLSLSLSAAAAPLKAKRRLNKRAQYEDVSVTPIHLPLLGRLLQPFLGATRLARELRGGIEAFRTGEGRNGRPVLSCPGVSVATTGSPGAVGGAGRRDAPSPHPHHRQNGTAGIGALSAASLAARCRGGGGRLLAGGVGEWFPGAQPFGRRSGTKFNLYFL